MPVFTGTITAFPISKQQLYQNAAEQTRDPTGADDFAAGYALLMRWIRTDSPNENEWVCTGDGVWTQVGGGDVVGPGSATNNALARFDSTTGKLIKDSPTAIWDGTLLRLGASASSSSTSLVLNTGGRGYVRGSTSFNAGWYFQAISGAWGGLLAGSSRANFIIGNGFDFGIQGASAPDTPFSTSMSLSPWMTMNGTTANFGAQSLTNITSVVSTTLTGTNVIAGPGTPSATTLLTVEGGPSTIVGISAVSEFRDTTNFAAGVGARIVFSGKFDATNLSRYAALGGVKTNATSGNTAGDFVLYSRPNGGNLTERARVFDQGDMALGTSTAPTGTRGKTLLFGDNAGDPTPGTNTAAIYAADSAGSVRAKFRDEGGAAMFMVGSAKAAGAAPSATGTIRVVIDGTTYELLHN